jgi:hypothetical protein
MKRLTRIFLGYLWAGDVIGGSWRGRIGFVQRAGTQSDLHGPRAMPVPKQNTQQ